MIKKQFIWAVCFYYCLVCSYVYFLYSSGVYRIHLIIHGLPIRSLYVNLPLQEFRSNAKRRETKRDTQPGLYTICNVYYINLYPNRYSITKKREVKSVARSIYQLKRIANELLQHPEQSYTEIAEKTGINTNYPRINLYQTLQSDRFKAIMAEEIKKIYDKDELRETVSKWLRSDISSASLKAAELGMKEQAMLTERVETVTKPHDSIAEISTDDLQAELVQRLRIGKQGVFSDNKSPDGDKVAPKTPIDSKQESAIGGKA
jgi:hypothetical protein